MSDAGAAKTRRADAARLSAADARSLVMCGGYKEAAE
jgi:hypothetical protein